MKVYFYLLLPFLLISFGKQAQAQPIYVDQQASGQNDGSSWLNAFTDLQVALNTARNTTSLNDVIFIANGTYKPGLVGDRFTSFDIPEGTFLSGSWDHLDTTVQDWVGTPTVLSGEIATSLEQSVYHVVQILNAQDTVRLEGLTITKGFADGIARDQYGAGMTVVNSNVVGRDLFFLENYAVGDSARGAALYLEGAFVRILNYVFDNNRGENGSVDQSGGACAYVSADSKLVLREGIAPNNNSSGNGGAFWIDGGQLWVENGNFNTSFSQNGKGTIANVSGALFIDHAFFNLNNALGGGGAIWNNDSAFCFISNATFRKNYSLGRGGAILTENHSRAHLINVTFFENESSEEGGALAVSDSSRSVISHATITSNRANTVKDIKGGGIYLDSSSVVNINHSILQSNFGNNPEVLHVLGNAGGTFESWGYNRFEAVPLNLLAATDSNLYVPLRSDLEDNLGVRHLVNNPALPFSLTRTLRFAEDEYGFMNGEAFNAINQGAHNPLLLGNLTVAVANDRIATGADAIALEPFFFPPNANNAVIYEDWFERDQRGVARDNIPDIGAYEHREVEIILQDSLFLCPNSDQEELGTIIISDPSGGAILPGENQSIILEIPDGFEIDIPNYPFEVAFLSPNSDSSLSILAPNYSPTFLLFSYDKGFSADPLEIRISGIMVTAWEETLNDEILRIGGSARMLGNQALAQSYGKLRSGIAPRPDPMAMIRYVRQCADPYFGQEVVVSFEDDLVTNQPGSYWQWALERNPDPTLVASTADTARFEIQKGGLYPLTLVVGQDSLCSQVYIDTLEVLNTFDPLTDQGYTNNFDGDTIVDRWLTDNDEEYNNSWEWSAPGVNTPMGIGANGKGWFTNPDGPYQNDEMSYLLSPCIFIDLLTQPVLSMKMFVDTENGFDGASVQFKADPNNEFAPWYTLGWEDDRVEYDLNKVGGYNWYNNTDINSLPGGFDGQPVGWSGRKAGEWREVRYRLDQAQRFAGSNVPVRFRIAFASDDENDQTYFGVGVDDFFVGKQEAQVLLEEFNGVPAVMEAIDSVRKEGDVIRVRYPQVDLFYDMDVRALNYGIQGGPQVVMDGNYFLYDGMYELVAPHTQFNRRSASPLFVESNMLEISGEIDITARQDYNQTVQVFVITGELDDDSVLQAKNMIPNAAGVFFEGLRANNTVTVSANQQDADRQIPLNDALDPDRARALLVVQDAATKEVLYSNLLPAGELTRSLLSRNTAPPLAQEIRVFPNPATAFVQVTLDHLPEVPYVWTLTDMQGRLALSGRWKVGSPHQFIQLGQLSAGLYHLQVPLADGKTLQQKVSVVK